MAEARGRSKLDFSFRLQRRNECQFKGITVFLVDRKLSFSVSELEQTTMNASLKQAIDFRQHNSAGFNNNEK